MCSSFFLPSGFSRLTVKEIMLIIYRLSAMSSTPLGWFLELALGQLVDWFEVIAGEAERGKQLGSQ